MQIFGGASSQSCRRFYSSIVDRNTTAATCFPYEIGLCVLIHLCVSAFLPIYLRFKGALFNLYFVVNIFLHNPSGHGKDLFLFEVDGEASANVFVVSEGEAMYDWTFDRLLDGIENSWVPGR